MNTPRIGWAKDWDAMQQEDEKPPAALDYIYSDSLSSHERLILAADMINGIVSEYDRINREAEVANKASMMERVMAQIEEFAKGAELRQKNKDERARRIEANKEKRKAKARQNWARKQREREIYESTPEFKLRQAQKARRKVEQEAAYLRWEKMHDEKLQRERAEEAKKKALYDRAIIRETEERERWYLNERARMAQVSAEIRRAEWDEYVEKRRQLYMGVIWPELPVAELNRAAKRMGLELH